MNNNREIILLDKGFVISVVEALKSLDVRGFESNEKLVSIVRELQQAVITKLPIEFAQNQSTANEAKADTVSNKTAN